MNRMSLAGLVATGLLSMTALTGCSDDPAPGPGAGGNASTGGTGSGTGGGVTAGSGNTTAGTKLDPPNSFTILTDAPAGAAAPAAFSANICSTCHGNNAEGVLNNGPEIRHLPATYATWVVRNGGARGAGFSSMAAFPPSSLSDPDLQGIIAWSNSLPRPTTPEGLYKDFCGNCHGPMNPTGGAVPVNIKGLSMGLVQTYVRSGNGTNPMERNEYMPAFDMTQLSDQELAQIQTFLGSTSP